MGEVHLFDVAQGKKVKVFKERSNKLHAAVPVVV